MGLVMQLLFGDSEVKKLMRGRNPGQKKVILYFVGGNGCLNPAMKDEEYDAMIQAFSQAEDYRRRALKKLGIDEDQVKEIDPVHFENFVVDERTIEKYGTDRLLRSTKYQITWLFFSSDQVYLWQYTVAFDDDERKERTEEYFYRDITAFSSSSDTVEKRLLDKITCSGKREYTRKNVDTSSFTLVVPGEKFHCSMKQNDTNEKAIKGLKALLREKKG